MKENTQEKSLVKLNENSIFYKIKMFFINIFGKHETINNTAVIEEQVDVKVNNIEEKSFKETIKNIEDEETKLLKLQKQYRSGEIKGEDLTHEQVMQLCGLYDRQIENLRKSNEKRKERLREYRRKLQTSN